MYQPARHRTSGLQLKARQKAYHLSKLLGPVRTGLKLRELMERLGPRYSEQEFRAARLAWASALDEAAPYLAAEEIPI